MRNHRFANIKHFDRALLRRRDQLLMGEGTKTDVLTFQVSISNSTTACRFRNPPANSSCVAAKEPSSMRGVKAYQEIVTRRGNDRRRSRSLGRRNAGLTDNGLLVFRDFPGRHAFFDKEREVENVFDGLLKTMGIDDETEVVHWCVLIW